MLFNSISFLLFLPVVFAIYWMVNKRGLQLQNVLLLVASYFFYACWDWRFLFLLIFSTALDYFTGLKMHDAPSQHQKKFWFWLSIAINLGFLGVFKYFNFFAESLVSALEKIGFHASFWTLEVILPVGISFYTFHGLSYVIDIYKNRITPERNVVTYSLFVSYFPLLVAGPIERATHLLPQLKKKRVFSYQQAVDGLRQILWGLFKKVVIADNCAFFANAIFDHPENYSGSSLVLGAVFFAFQIYGDFSGYSDIALGTSKLFGIDLLKNFNFPYFSRDIAEFWRRWHISLSSWFKDYLYIPLGGSRGGNFNKIKNTFIIFLVSGFWHGANWTFIVWGLLNALFILPSIVFNTNRDNIDIVAKNKWLPNFKETFQMMITFGLVCFAWIFFRAESVENALDYISGIISPTLFSVPKLVSNSISTLTVALLIMMLMITEWIQREKNHGLEFGFSNQYRFFRWLCYLSVFMMIMIWGVTSKTEFIYFAF